MLLPDMLVALARKDYVDRRRRQAEGTAKAKASGRYKDRPEDVGRNAGIATLLRAGAPWQQFEQAFGCSRNTIVRVRKRLDAVAVETAQACSAGTEKGNYPSLGTCIGRDFRGVMIRCWPRRHSRLFRASEPSMMLARPRT